MGKLAQRYADAARSGLYRVRDSAVPRAAAAEAGIRTVEASAAALADGGWDAFARSVSGAAVVLIDSAGALAARREADYSRLVAALQRLAHGAREKSQPFFAVMVDPGGELALPGLYKESE